jgi:hypothetical protein
VQRGVQRARSIAARTVRQCWRTGVKLKAVAVASCETTYTSLFFTAGAERLGPLGPTHLHVDAGARPQSCVAAATNHDLHSRSVGCAAFRAVFRAGDNFRHHICHRVARGSHFDAKRATFGECRNSLWNL